MNKEESRFKWVMSPIKIRASKPDVKGSDQKRWWKQDWINELGSGQYLSKWPNCSTVLNIRKIRKTTIATEKSKLKGLTATNRTAVSRKGFVCFLTKPVSERPRNFSLNQGSSGTNTSLSPLLTGSNLLRKRSPKKYPAISANPDDATIGNLGDEIFSAFFPAARKIQPLFQLLEVRRIVLSLQEIPCNDRFLRAFLSRKTMKFPNSRLFAFSTYYAVGEATSKAKTFLVSYILETSKLPRNK